MINPSILITPNYYGEGKLLSIIPTDGSGDLNVVRATTATRVNAEGLIEVVPYNLLLNSLAFAANYSYSQCSITSSQVAPDGSNNAKRITNGITATDSYFEQSISFTAGTYTWSIFVKQGTAASASIKPVHIGLGGAVSLMTFTFATETITSSGSISSTGFEKLSNGWYRIFCSIDIPSSVSSLRGRFGNPNVANVYNDWAFPQLVQGTEAKEYLRTETRLNIPRLDYTNGSCPSILVEPQRTNLALRSEEFSNSSFWALSNLGTITSNNIISPDGTQNADTFNAGANFSQVQGAIVGTTGTVYTVSMWVKRITGTGNVFLRAVENADTLISVTSDWQRITATVTSTTTTIRIGIKLATSGDAIAIWGAQLEVGSNATSYIPTVASAVTRNADVISKTGIADLIGQSEGTLFVDMNFINNYNTGRLLAIGDGSTNNRIFINITTNNTFQVFIRNTAGIQYSFLSSANRPTGRYKLALAYKQNDFAFYLNGVLINSSTSGQVPPNLNNLYLSTSEFGSTAVELNSINSALIIPTRLDNATLATLTTL